MFTSLGYERNPEDMGRTCKLQPDSGPEGNQLLFLFFSHQSYNEIALNEIPLSRTCCTIQYHMFILVCFWSSPSCSSICPWNKTLILPLKSIEFYSSQQISGGWPRQCGGVVSGFVKAGPFQFCPYSWDMFLVSHGPSGF